MPIEIKTRYITPDDFKIYWGVDLNAKMTESGNPSNSADAFIMRLEDMVEAYIQGEYHRKIYFDKMTDQQKIWFRKGLLEEGMFLFRNGYFYKENFLLNENREKITVKEIKDKILDPIAKEYFRMCGLLCTHIGNSSPFYLNPYWLDPDK